MANSFEVRLLYRDPQSDTALSHLEEFTFAVSMAMSGNWTSMEGFMEAIVCHMGLYGEENNWMESEVVTTSCGFTITGDDVRNAGPTWHQKQGEETLTEFVAAVLVKESGTPMIILHFCSYSGIAGWEGYGPQMVIGSDGEEGSHAMGVIDSDVSVLEEPTLKTKSIEKKPEHLCGCGKSFFRIRQLQAHQKKGCSMNQQ
jgi:hypothetical protein